jgi:hypothetical protein
MMLEPLRVIEQPGGGVGPVVVIARSRLEQRLSRRQPLRGCNARIVFCHLRFHARNAKSQCSPTTTRLAKLSLVPWPVKNA